MKLRSDSSSNISINSLLVNDIKITDKKEMDNNFNTFFSSFESEKDASTADCKEDLQNLGIICLNRLVQN